MPANARAEGYWRLGYGETVGRSVMSRCSSSTVSASVLGLSGCGYRSSGGFTRRVHEKCFVLRGLAR